MFVFKSSTVVFTYHIHYILSLFPSLLYLYIYSQYQVHIVLTESTQYDVN
jgi:uncharacterized protein Usg